MLGNLSSVKHWLLGTKNRKWWIYYSNGSTKETFIYKMGVLNGKALKYYPNGQILSDKSYKSDKLSGEYIEYYMQGRSRSQGVMVEDEMDGKWKFWHHNGQMECELECHHGEIIESKVWDDEGNIKEELQRVKLSEDPNFSGRKTTRNLK